MRILIIAYHFPPLNSTASHRSYSWARAWSAAGHEVHVLTPARHAFDGALDLEHDLRGITVHTAPFLGATGAPAAARDRQAYAASARRWNRLKVATRRVRLGFGMFTEIASLGYFSLVGTGLGVLRSARFDFIISTSPPEVAHFAGHALAERTGVPWVADYRDLWFPDMRLHHFRWVAAVTGRLSRRLLASAKLVSTVSQGLAARLGGYLGRAVHICYNGYFSGRARAAGGRPWTDDRVHLVYTGRLYPSKRDPRVFLDALGRALEAAPEIGQRVAVELYGCDEPWLRQLVEQHGVSGCVNLHGVVPHDVSLAAQRHADYLLFVDWMDPGAEGVLSGKLFEYLDSGRPIVCVGNNPHSEAAELIRSAQAGEVLTGVAAMQTFVEEAARQPSPAALAAAGVEQYSREYQAARLLAAVRQAIGRAAP
jgi:glycosyltransferase involved in cell wall biosynthesis